MSTFLVSIVADHINVGAACGKYLFDRSEILVLLCPHAHIYNLEVVVRALREICYVVFGNGQVPPP